MGTGQLDVDGWNCCSNDDSTLGLMREEDLRLVERHEEDTRKSTAA